MAERAGEVWVLADRAALPAAIAAALTVIGWPAVRLLARDALEHAAQRPGRARRLVIVADQEGRLPDPRPALAGRMRPLVVAVGSRTALPGLAHAVERFGAATALDADQPFARLVAALDAALLRQATTLDTARLALALRARDAEARRFAELTSREQDVLGHMVQGRVAAEIAATGHVSLATVRSHIRAVLAKLGVSSQVAAVALTQRACREPQVMTAMRQVHQF